MQPFLLMLRIQPNLRELVRIFHSRLEEMGMDLFKKRVPNWCSRLIMHKASDMVYTVWINFTVINGKELYPAFSNYIASMKEIGGETWTPGYWDGINESVIRLKSYEESPKKPKDILAEMKAHFKDITKESIHNTLPESARMRRRKIIGMLASNFHPDSFFVKALPLKQQREREEIFKTRISPNIVDDTIYGLLQLDKLVREFGMPVE